MKITFLGHASLLIETQGKTIIVDPFISATPAAEKYDVNTLKADFVLLTHGHQDHVLDAEVIAKNNQAPIISNFEIVSWYNEKGLEGHGMNIGGKFNFDFGTLKYVNALHSSVLPDGTYGGNPGGFVLWNKEGCVYIAGDTALTEDMKYIPMTCPQPDLAVLPIGDNFTMGYEDAALAAGLVNVKKVLGYHFDTFPPIAIDHNAAKAHFNDRAKELILPEIGQSLEV